MPIRLNGAAVDERTLRAIAAFVLLYVGAWAVGGGIIAIDSAIVDAGLGPLDSLGASATALGNVGPGFGVTGPFGSFAPLGDVSKLTMIALMFLGRLEIVPVVVLADAPLLAALADPYFAPSRTLRRSSAASFCTIASTWSPGRITVLSSTSSVRPCRKTEISRDPSGSLTPPDARPGDGRVRLDLHLDDLEALLRELEQAHEAVLGKLVLDEAEDARRRTDGLLDPEQLEVLLVARVVHARDRLGDLVALLADLRDHEVVLVVARDREQELRRAGDARALEHADLRRVAAHHDRAELRPRAARSGRGAARSSSPRGPSRAASACCSTRPSRRPRRRRTSGRLRRRGRAAPARSRAGREIAVCVGHTVFSPGRRRTSHGPGRGRERRRVRMP